MPKKLPSPCSYPMCPELTTERFCSTHKKDYAKRRDQYRGSSAERGYDARWRKARRWFLARNPLCMDCNHQGLLKEATVVDHITPHKGNHRLFWDEDNWQPLCKKHHDQKTVREDGGFGR